MRTPPSGEQFEIRSGGQRAVVVEVGGGLRDYTVDGEPLLDGYSAEQMATGGRGQALLPWPNRLADGSYTFQGREIRVPINEPERNCAIHGLTRWLNWSDLERDEDRVVMGLHLHPQPAYPFELELRLEYSLSDSGLSVLTQARNLGPADLPFGAGFHPYLRLTPGLVDELTLILPAPARLEADGRGLPTGDETTVEGTESDFRAGLQIGARQLDTCFTALRRGPDGRATVKLSSSSKRLDLWVDPAFKHLMIFTGDTLAPEERRRSLAVEPMTCPPNALQTGTDLITLAPDQAFSGSWGLVPG